LLLSLNLRRAQALTDTVKRRAVRFPEIAGSFRFIWRHACPRASPAVFCTICAQGGERRFSPTFSSARRAPTRRVDARP
jgi:hypothetical protein